MFPSDPSAKKFIVSIVVEKFYRPFQIFSKGSKFQIRLIGKEISTVGFLLTVVAVVVLLPFDEFFRPRGHVILLLWLFWQPWRWQPRPVLLRPINCERLLYIHRLYFAHLFWNYKTEVPSIFWTYRISFISLEVVFVNCQKQSINQ